MRSSLSGPFGQRGPAHCPRCRQTVEATWPWPQWRTLRKAWFVILGLVFALSPILLADIYVVLPSTLVFVVAIGPLNAMAKLQPTCLRCGGVVVPVQSNPPRPEQA